MTDRREPARLFFGAAALAALTIGTIACSGTDDASDTLAPIASAAGVSTTAPAPTTTTAFDPTSTAVVTSTTTVAAATTVPIDGAALLRQALDSIAGGYHFTTTVTVDGNVVVTADGDRVGNGARVGVEQNGASVQYVITPAGTWVQTEGGDWQELDSPDAMTDPIAALRSPLSVAVDSVSGTGTRLSVSVTPASLGLEGDTPVVVLPLVDGTTLRDVLYTATVNGRPATVQASVGPIVDGTPVVAPV